MPRSLGEGEARLALGGVLGGVLLAAGAALPWMTFFAGLHRLSGLLGWNGRLLLAGGALCVAAGVAAALRPERAATAARVTMRALGVGALVLGAWVVVGLRDTLAELAAQPLLVARPGPGIVACLVGGVVVTLASWWPARGGQGVRGAEVGGVVGVAGR